MQHKLPTQERVNYDLLPADTKELILYAENDGQLYNQRYIPIVKNLKRKISRGEYDADRAVDAYRHLLNDARKKYNKEIEGDQFNITKDDVDHASKYYADKFEEEYNIGAFDNETFSIGEPKNINVKNTNQQHKKPQQTTATVRPHTRNVNGKRVDVKGHTRNLR